MKYWLLSDPHFHHPAMLALKARPADYADRIFKGLEKIPAGDVLICLGDITIGNDEEVHRKYIQPLKCRKILVKGNHDKKSSSWYLSHGWDFVCRDFHDKLFGQYIIFSHVPTSVPEHCLNIHGHLHARLHRNEGNFQNCRLVSCELQGYFPQTLKSFLKNNVGLFHKKKDHEKETFDTDDETLLQEKTEFSETVAAAQSETGKNISGESPPE